MTTPRGNFEQWVAEESERLKRRRQADARKRRKRETTAPKPVRKPGRPKSMRTCSLFGCNRPHHARGLCNTHARRYYRQRVEDKR